LVEWLEWGWLEVHVAARVRSSVVVMVNSGAVLEAVQVNSVVVMVNSVAVAQQQVSGAAPVSIVGELVVSSAVVAVQVRVAQGRVQAALEVAAEGSCAE
jgi:hypothetical protein